MPRLAVIRTMAGRVARRRITAQSVSRPEPRPERASAEERHEDEQRGGVLVVEAEDAREDVRGEHPEGAVGQVDDARATVDRHDPRAEQRDGAALGEPEHQRPDDQAHGGASPSRSLRAQWPAGPLRAEEIEVRHDGSLGPVPERRMPVIPPRWRLPALVVTVVVCIALFVSAVLIGTHG